MNFEFLKKLFASQRTDEQELAIYENKLTNEEKLVAYRANYPIQEIEWVEDVIINNYEACVNTVKKYYNGKISDLYTAGNVPPLQQLTNCNEIIKEAKATIEILEKEYVRLKNTRGIVEVTE